MFEDVILAPVHPAARPEAIVQGHIEKAESNTVFFRDVVIYAAVVLCGFGVVHKCLVINKGYVRAPVKPAARGGTDDCAWSSCVLAQVHTPDYRRAIRAFRKAQIRAG